MEILTESKNFRTVKFILITAAFFAFLNETYLNIALSNFAEIFHVPMATVQWLTTGFMLVMTIVLPTTAFLIQRFTTRQIFITTMLLIIAGTLIGAFSQYFWMLLVGRLIQAAGTCVLMSLLMNTILLITPQHKRGTAMGILGVVILFAPTIAPTFAGVILQFFHWRYLFFILLPFFITICLLGVFYLRNVTETVALPIDMLSVVLSAIAFGGILYGISIAGENGVTTPALVWLGIGIFGLIVFVWRQLIAEEPFLELRTFRYPMFTFGVILIIVNVMTMFGALLLIPIFLGGVLGLSTSIIGLAMLPGGIINGIASLAAGRIFDRVGPRYLVIPGILLMIAVFGSFSLFSGSTSIKAFIVAHCFLSIANSMVTTAVQTNGLNQLPREYYPHGTAIMATLQQLGGGLGTAVFISIFLVHQEAYVKNVLNSNEFLQQSAAVTSGFQHAFAFAVILLVFAFLVSLFIKRSSRVEEQSFART
jgi:DHA2 family lincomycin resistance protein-like MFS transporter